MHVTVRPREGLIVRHPATGGLRPRLLSPEGERVPLITYWQRQIMAGSVVVVADATNDEE